MSSALKRLRPFEGGTPNIRVSPKARIAQDCSHFPIREHRPVWTMTASNMHVLVSLNGGTYEGEVQDYHLLWEHHRIDLNEVKRIDFDRSRRRNGLHGGPNLMRMKDGTLLNLGPKKRFGPFRRRSTLKGYIVAHVSSLGEDIRFDLDRIQYLYYQADAVANVPASALQHEGAD